MTTELPVWRAALKDGDHPLHQAAWLLFSTDSDIETVTRLLAGKKAEVIPFAQTILDTPELYELDSLGGGNAPFNAAELLIHWQVIEALPRLIEIMLDNDAAGVSEMVLEELPNMGPEIIDEVIATAKEQPPLDINRLMLVMVAGDRAIARPQDFDFFRAEFEQYPPDHGDIGGLLDPLLYSDFERGKAFLEEKLQQKEYAHLRPEYEAHLRFLDQTEA